jgi:molecular chaperone Hsp33
MTEALPHDSLVHALAFDDRVRVVVAATTGIVRAAAAVHGGSPYATVALGRVLTAAALLESASKGLERLSLQVEGGGPLGVLIGRALPDGNVYGAVSNPHGLPQTDGATAGIADAVGRNGRLVVVRDTGASEPYVGVVELVSGEIGDDVAAYLMQSEQIRSAIGLGVQVDAEGAVTGAGGVLLQLLGGVDEDEIAELEAALDFVGHVSERVAAGDSAETIARCLLLPGLRILHERPLRFAPPTDRSYYRARLARLNAAALDELFGEDESIELTCDFTGERHVFTRADLRSLGDA